MFYVEIETHTKIIDFSRWFFCNNKIVKIILGFMDVFEFLSNSKNWFCCFKRSKKRAFACIFQARGAQAIKSEKKHNASRVRSEDFHVNLKVVKKTMGIHVKFEHDESRSKKSIFGVVRQEDIFRSQSRM